MGKVKQSKKSYAQPSEDVVRFVDAVATCPDAQLVTLLARLDVWRFSRGDLHGWIPALDRFDAVLEGIVKSYELDKPQLNPFTPQDKILLLEVLRVYRLLLENCTSRKLFASYDRCYDLLCTSDLAVLQSTLIVLLRPTQQYLSETPIDPTLKTNIRQRLLALCRGWDKLKGHGWDLLSLAFKEEFESPRDPVTVSFYPNHSASSSKGETSSTMDLSNLTQHTYPDDLAEKARDAGMPIEAHFSAFVSLRISFMQDREERRQLLGARLLAIATYVSLAREDAVNHTLCLYEPDIVADVCELLHPSREVGDTVRAAALLALDGFSHHKSRLGEVLTSLNISANYGVLMTLLRSIAKNQHSLAVADAMLSFVGFLVVSPGHNAVLVGAGILNILLDFLSVEDEKRINYIPRVCGLIDTIVFSNQQGFTTFTAIDGVNTIVARIKDEISRPVDLPKEDLVSGDSMISWAMAPIRALLRTVQRLMQASGGTEGLRNLVDGDLPKSIKRIFEENEKFGPRVYSIAINVMAAFINNEPTSLSILQELQLPETLYAQLEKSIPTSSDVLNSVPNAISAICLNPAGLALTNTHSNILVKLVSACVDASASDQISQTTGSALEELARHQPPLRDVIQDAAMSMLTATLRDGQDFTVPADQEHLYLLDKIPRDGNVPKDPPTNAPIEKLSKVLQFFEGFLRNATVCKHLIKENNIIDLFLSVSDLPCIPTRWGTTDAAHHLSHVFRVIGGHDHIVVVEKILQAVHRGLDECAELWQPGSHPIWQAFHEGTATDGQRRQFQQLRAAIIRLTYLGESFSSLTFSHSRAATSLAKCLRKAPEFVRKFGALHKTAIREHAVLREEVEFKETDLLEVERENGKESGAKFMATRIHAVSDMFFKAGIRLLFVKRHPDGSHASEAKKLANLIAEVLVSHLDVELVEGKEAAIRTFALGTCTSMLFDERGYEGYFNTLLLVAFNKKGGLDGLVRTAEELLKGGNTEQNGINSMQLVTKVLSAFVSSRALIESPQTGSVAGLSPSEMLVRIRARLFPIIRQIWDADWLSTAKEETVKLAIKAFLAVVEGKAETDAAVPTAAALPTAHIPVPRVRPTATPALVDQLVDMGFNRGAAVAALMRAHNNIGAAAELILSAPHIYADMPEPAAPAAAPAAPAIGGAGAAVPADAAAPIAAANDDAPAPAPAVPAESPTAEVDDPMESTDDIGAIREALDAERKLSKEGMATRGIELLDHAEDLVFQLSPAFPTGQDGVRFVLARLREVMGQDDKLAARLRLGVITLNMHSSDVTPELQRQAHDILSGISIDPQNRPRWTAAFLLFGETLLRLSLTITEAKLGAPGTAEVTVQGDFKYVRQILFNLSVALIEDAGSERPDMLAAMRMLVILSRQESIVDKLPILLAAFAKPSPRLRDCHPLLALIIRHAFEDDATLSAVMRREIQAWTTPARNKVSDITHFVRQLRQAAFRAPQLFINVVEAECTLVDPSPTTSVFHIRSKNVKEATESDPFKEKPTNESGKAVFMTLLSELFKSVAIVRGEGEQKDKESTLNYVGLLVSLITEVLGSYIPAKQSFLAVLRSSSSIKGIGGLLADMVCDVSLKDTADTARGFEVETRMTLSKWGSSMVIALCSDIAATIDIKDLPDDLVSVRKQVLDAMTKAIKESGNQTDLDVRYGRLHALGELTYRLLVARPTVTTKQDESGTHIAKTMIEKNFVGTLTAAAGEVDLNYPEVKGVLGSLLKALEYLSKMSIKWSKSDKRKIAQEEEGTTSDSEDSEMDYDEPEEEEAPDLYRNSALARLGGGVDEDEEDEDEDEDEGMQFGDEGDDMDDATGSQPLTDEDEDDDMGEGENDWSDEEDELESLEGDGVVFEQDPIIGEAEDAGLGEVWDDEGGMDENSSDEEGEGPYPEEEMYDEEEELLDEEGFDDFDLMDGEEGMPWADAPPEPSGPWGWLDQPAARGGRPTRLGGHDEDVMAALYGGPPPRPTVSSVAAHPLLAAPVAPPPLRRLPRGHGGAIGLDALLRHIQSSGATDAIAAIDSITNQHRYSGGEPVRMDLTQEQDGTINLRIGTRIYRVPAGGAPRPETEGAADFVPRPTTQRWQEEYSIIPGRDLSAQLVIHIINRLMPEAKRLADEESAKRDKEEAEAEQKRQEAEKKEEAERQERTLAEAKRLADDLAAAAAVALPVSTTPIPPQEDVEMESEAVVAGPSESAEAGPSEPMVVDPQAEAGPSESAAPAESLARTVIQIHGRDVDITDTGIDLDFLQALPDDMRAEVVDQHMREQARHQRPAANASAPAASSQINHEFLQALPPSIRAEVLMQEAVENARRNRPTAAAAPAPAPAPAAVPNLLDLAGFDPGMLAGFDELLMQGLAGLNGPGGPDAAGLFNIARRNRPHQGVPNDVPAPIRKPHRETLQLLDKNGIANLVRLLFFPEAFRKGHLFRILVNLCENSTTRADLLNLLISVVQDGSGDLPAVDRSFQQMSLRGVATPKATPKLKAPETPGPIALPIFAHLQSENIPTFIAQRCFEALSYIVSANQQAVTFFLTEHDQAIGLRKAPSRKGKGKEKLLPQTKYPIVILLGLLDRPVLLKTNAMMESITLLLQTITKPLATLKAETKEAEEKKEDAMETEPAPVAVPETPAVAAPVPAPDTAGPSVLPAGPATLTKPPIIPPNVLRLVVNCMTSGECSSRTFGNSLMLMQNLCSIPDGKETIVSEISLRCKELGTTIQTGLLELAKELGTAEAGETTWVSKFSAASSSQAQLLRLLKTVDFLHTHKSADVDAGATLSENEQKVADIFASFRFEGMWERLSACLKVVEQTEATEQAAVVLLPLIEALMVICKYRPKRAGRSPSEAPQTNDSDLFVSFTTAHRKVLNSIVRNNPSLLSGSFSLLVRNSRVLEFDNKRNWFFQKLKRKKEHHAAGNLHLNIRRQYVFEDSFHALQRRSGDEIKYGKLNIKFYNEDGVDAGGVTREWYSVLARQIFDPNFALFEPCAADQLTYQPNKASAVNGEHLAYFKFVGRVIGKSIYDGRLLDAYFSRAFYKQILGRDVDIRDLESIDPEYHKSLTWMLDNDITGVIDQEFTIEDDQFGEKKIVELKEGGAKIPVTEENKGEYVRLVVSYRLDNSIKEQNKAFLDGFYDVIPRTLIEIFEPDQLELLISGITTVDVDELKNATQMSGWKSTDPEIAWFWRALRSFSQEERSRFLMFVTSSSRVPLGGFTQLQGASGIQPFQIQKLYSKDGSLPQASTCFNLLLLPKYETYEQLKDRLMFAVTETGGFGKA